jgi:hypothetical protein
MSEAEAPGHRATHGAARGSGSRAAALVALAGALAVTGALSLHTPAAPGPAPRGPAEPLVAMEPRETPRSGAPDTVTAAETTTTASVPDAPVEPQPPRIVIDPKDALTHGSKEPLVPPEIFVDVELAPRGVLTAEPLAPRVLSVDVDVPSGPERYPRGAPTAEPLAPRVLSLDEAPEPD